MACRFCIYVYPAIIFSSIDLDKYIYKIYLTAI